MKKASTHKRVEFNGPEPVTNKKAKTTEEDNPIEEDPIEDHLSDVEQQPPSPPQVQLSIPCGWDDYDCVTAIEIYDTEDICYCPLYGHETRHLFPLRYLAMSFHYDNLCNMESC